MTVISLIRKTAAVFLAAALSAAMLSGRNLKFDKGILYKVSNDTYSSEMCRLDVGYEEGGEMRPVIDEYAPLGLVRGDAAPFLVISADREMELFGRYEETAYFVRMLKLNGHKDVTFYELEGFDHGDMARPGHLVLLKYIRERSRKD